MATLLLAPFYRKKPCSPRNVLFVELSEMGSAVLADPAMRKVSRETRCDLYFLIFRKNSPSLHLLTTVKPGNIFVIREDGLLNLLVDSIKFLSWARYHKIDTVIDLELFSRFTALLTGLSGATNRVGFYSFHNEGLYRGHLLSHKVAYNPHIHIAKNFIALVNALLAREREIPFSKTLIADSEITLEKVTPDAIAIRNFIDSVNAITGSKIVSRQQKIILINPNASELLIQRRWMPEYYVELAQCILNNYKEAIILLTGDQTEFEQAEEMRLGINNARCYNTAGLFRFDQLPLLYSISHLMVTNDSGPAHFSAITSLRVFVLFGPETPSLYGSLGNATAIYKGLACSPCVNAANHRKTDCQNNVCLQLIKPAEVFDLIKPDLDKKPRALESDA